MRPYTLALPKPMIDVNGEPFLAHLLRSVAKQGVVDVILLIGYLGDHIVDFVGDGDAYGLRVRYVRDGERAMGTAGAVRRALPMLGERFLVTYGDAYLNVDYRAVVADFEQSGCGGLMTVFRWDGTGATKPNAALRGNRVTRYDKETAAPEVQYVDYGLSAFNAWAFDHIPADEPADLASVNQRLIAASQLAAFIVDHLPFEIGSPQGLEAARSFLRSPS